jgi:hypothetical protein
MPEDEFKQRVIDAAILYGWHVHHSRPARTKEGWRTALQGHAGLPDLVLARNGVVLLAELKTDRAQPTLNQRGWLQAAGPNGRLWRPADWPDILTELAAGRYRDTGLPLRTPGLLG